MRREIVYNQKKNQKNFKFHFVYQNIHLVASWLPRLEKKLEAYSETAHADYRVFMSAEPASRPESHVLPQVNKRPTVKFVPTCF